MTDKVMCSEMVSRQYSFHPGRCLRKGVVEGPDGRMWCTQHDPVAVKERERVREARFNTEMAARKRNTRSAGIEAVLVELESMRDSDQEVGLGLPEGLHIAIDTLRRKQKKGEL